MAGETHPAQWLPDPMERHEYRYWDGQTWTEHVADSGVTARDPLLAPPVADEPEGASAPVTAATPAVAGERASKSGGLFAGMRRASEQRKAQRAQQHYESELAAWSRDDAELQGLIVRARHFDGSPAGDTPLNLKRNERIFYVLTGAGLMETRAGPRHWQGGYSGFSFRVAKGIRYHVGGTRGTSVQGDDTTKLIDTGTATITNQRIVFQGAKQAREWAFAKLLGYQHDQQSPWTPIQVSNRQKVSGIRYDANTAQAFQFNLALALATFHDTRGAFVAGLAAEFQQHQAQKPVPPVTAAAAGATTVSASQTTSGGQSSGMVATFRRAPLWVRIVLPIVLLLVALGVIGAVAGGGSSDGSKSASARHAAPIVTAATNPVTTTTAPPTTLPPTTVPPTTAPPATEAPAPPPTETPIQAPPAQQVVTPGAFCAPVGATGVTSAGTAMICSATSANGTPYTQPRWRSA
jgi:Protein of unknown function (DUF2510)